MSEPLIDYENQYVGWNSSSGLSAEILVELPGFRRKLVEIFSRRLTIFRST